MSKQDSELAIHGIHGRNQQKREREKSLLPESSTKDKQQKVSP